MCQFILPLWLSISGSHGPPPRVENVTSASKVEIPKSVERWFLDGGHALDSQCPHCRSHRENKRQIQKRTFSLSQGGRGYHVKRIFWVTSRASGYDGAESQSCFDLWDFFPSGCLPEQWKIIALTLEIFSEKTYLQEAEHEESEGVEEIRRNARNSTLLLSTPICLHWTHLLLALTDMMTHIWDWRVQSHWLHFLIPFTENSVKKLQRQLILHLLLLILWNLQSILKYFDMKHLFRSFEIVETVKEENMSARYVTSDMLLVLWGGAQQLRSGGWKTLGFVKIS